MPTTGFPVAARNRLTFAQARPGVARDRLLGFAGLLLFANAIPSFVNDAVRSQGWLAAAFNLFDISAIIWVALAAALALCWRSTDFARVRPLDWAVIVVASLATLIPVPPLSGVMLSVVAAWGWLVNAPRSPGRRAAAILLAISAFLVWGRALLALGAGPLLGADAALVGAVSGMNVSGNIVGFDGGGRFVIAPGCSSLHGISLALVLWVTIVGWFDLRTNPGTLAVLALGIAATVMVNCLRLVTIALRPTEFDYWHTGTGGALYGALALVVLVLVYWVGLRGAIRAA